MPKPLKLGLVVLVNLVILAALSEIVSIATYYAWTGSFFYTRSGRWMDETLTRPVEAPGRAGGQGETFQQLHPYFGFIDRPGAQHRSHCSEKPHFSNSFGFLSEYPYPRKKRSPNEFFVGVFGGSVAVDYALCEIDVQTLAKALQTLPGLAHREIVILPFAVRGFKQPQQLQVLSYFLSIGQEFDLVINIDGFNEVALSYLNYKHDTEPSFPSDFIFSPLVELATGDLSRDELALTVSAMDRKESLRKAVDSMKEAHTATGYLLSWARARYAMRRYSDQVAALDQAHRSRGRPAQTYMQIPAGPALNEEEALGAMVSVWSRSSLMMKHLLDARSVPYFHFLQPNQYFETHRVFSAKEKAIAINESSLFRPGAVKGYPLLLAELGRLRQSGVNAFSAVNIFDDIKEPVYLDSCCHFNEAGSVAFGNEVATTIVRTMSSH